MRYFICLSYDGSPFCGWQIQPTSPSVQQCLEQALSRLLGGRISVTGAGRTDTGVHSLGYIAQFEYPDTLPYERRELCYKLNAILPHSVAVYDILPVPDGFHARFDARRREYSYFIHRRKDPFVRAWSWQCGYPDLDFEAMNEACRYLLGTHDFTCFEKSGADNKTSICTVYEAYWAPYTPSHIKIMGAPSLEASLRPEGEVPAESLGERSLDASLRPEGDRRVETVGQSYWYFRISADRFLRNMVRATVGTLIEMGRGKHSPEWVASLLESGTRSDAGESVPAHALFLGRVTY
ncbi:MAG: tRNA pseudouridine synthase A [Bacteroidales bacterium]|nr:tRNA pseudouridine synthase A [Bacteroidales bacterium]